MQWMGLKMISCGMAFKRIGMLGGVSRRWRWRQWHWLVKVDRIGYMLCIKCTKLIVKYFFLEWFLFFGGSSWGKSSCIWVNMKLMGHRFHHKLCSCDTTKHVYIKRILTSGLRVTDIAKEMPKNEPHICHSVGSYFIPCVQTRTRSRDTLD